MTNSLGNFTFIRIDAVSGGGSSNPPLIPAEQLRVVERPGVNGSGIIKLGKKAEQIVMRSYRDLPSRDVGNQVVRNYRGLMGGAPQTLIWNDTNYDGFDTKFVVLNVVSVDLRTLHNMTGGLEGTRTVGGYLVADWTIKPVPS